MKTHFVLSTLTASQRYTNYIKGENDLPLVVSEVFVAGGAGVANGAIITPEGVATAITDEQKLSLEANDHFQFHMKNGFVKFSTEKVDPEKFAADMARRDGSAPLVPQDADEAGGEKVTSEAGTPKAGKSR